MPANKTTPLVCVVTRTKDRAVLLDRAVQSVHAQTMGDFIQVIINDGGKKEAVDSVLKKYPEFTNKIKVIHNPKSTGMYAACNQAIKSVDSTYIAVHDDDDSWHPEFLAQTTNHLESSGEQGVWAITDQITEEIKGNVVKRLNQIRWQPELRDVNLYMLCLYNYAPPISILYRRSVLNTIGYYSESMGPAADWDFAIRFLIRYDLEFLDYPNGALAFYHHRPNATGTNGNSVISGVDEQQKIINKILNKYLREDIQKGKLGIGYIMNALKHDAEDAKLLRENVDTIYRTLTSIDDNINMTRGVLSQKSSVGQRVLNRFKGAK